MLLLTSVMIMFRRESFRQRGSERGQREDSDCSEREKEAEANGGEKIDEEREIAMEEEALDEDLNADDGKVVKNI
eukprot:m.148655 g.148655  ORF g.148655 m.148655 type:complete len:75 (+) comp38500_c0_seq3:410-634(+)